MSQPKPQVEATEAVKPVGERTDRELENALNAFLRSNVTRRKQVTKLNAEIGTCVDQADAILDEQARRLTARKSKPVEAQVSEKEDRNQPGSRCRECGDSTFSCEHWAGQKGR